MRNLLVMKFGGTSVGTAERLHQAALLVAAEAGRRPVVVVVSAMAGITDLLLRAVEAARAQDDVTLEGALSALDERHEAALAALLAEPRRSEVGREVRAVLQQFRSFCGALCMLRSVTPQALDVVLPMGERMAALLLSAELQQCGLAAAAVDAARVLVTDERFGDAAPLMEATRTRAAEVLTPLYSAGIIPVVTGFGGATLGGQPTTLGRGGSDSSATLLGAALDAAEIWIWTDVDGVLTADPRLCPHARTLDAITYAEAIELSYYGAKVIHHKAIRPVVAAGIPVWIKNSFRPEVHGTRIDGRTPTTPAGSPVRAVTVVQPASLVTLTTRADVHFAELFGRLFLRLGHDNVDVLFSTQSSSENSLGLVLRQSDHERVISAIQRLFRMELKHGALRPISVQTEMAVIAVLGESMKGTSGILGRLFSAVAARDISVIAVAQGASELNICFAVAARQAPEAVRAVHDAFCLLPELQTVS